MSLKYKITGLIVLVLHIVGVVGTLYPPTRELVLSLTPLNLLISSLLIFFTHPGSTIQLALFLLILFSLGYTVEVFGVTTGFPFGEYTYGSTLGIKTLNVPLIIGLNWFLLTYSFGMILSYTSLSPILKIILSAGGMVLLDLLIEPVAISLDYWDWNGHIPISNYISWLFIGIIFQTIFTKFHFQNKNPFVFFLIGSQVLYFFLIFLMLN